MATEAEIVEELQRRGVDTNPPPPTGAVGAVKGIVNSIFQDYLRPMAAGAAGGATSLMGLPVEAGMAVSGRPGVTEQFKEATQTAESSFPGSETAYRFGEGMGVGAAFGGAFGGPPGAVVGGVLGGATNVAAKAITDNPIGQAAIGLVPTGVAGIVSKVRNAIPRAVPGPRVNPETDVPMTAGQQTGRPDLLVQEELLRRRSDTGLVAKEFDAAQAAQVDAFASKIQEFSANPNLTPTQVRDGVSAAYEGFNRRMINQFKADNKAAFNAAKAVKGDIIPTENVVRTVDDMIARYSGNTEVPGNAAIVNHLRKIREELGTAPKQTGLLDASGKPISVAPKSTNVPISVERLQQNLAAWADTASTGNYSSGTVTAFGDVAPGQAKGIAREILYAFKKDMDAAIDMNVPGVELLKTARNQFASGLEGINNMAVKPLTKFFNKNPNELVPEEVMTKLRSLPATQRAELAGVVEKVRPDILETVRKDAFAAQVAAAKDSANQLNTSKLYKTLGDSAENAWMFKSPAEKARFKSLTDNLAEIERKSAYKDISNERFNVIVRSLEEGAGAYAGALGRYGMESVVDAMRAIVSAGSGSKEKIAQMVFNPNGAVILNELAKPRPNLDKIPAEFWKTLISSTGAQAATARPGMPPDPRIAEIEAELARRKEPANAD